MPTFKIAEGRQKTPNHGHRRRINLDLQTEGTPARSRDNYFDRQKAKSSIGNIHDSICQDNMLQQVDIKCLFKNKDQLLEEKDAIWEENLSLIK